MKEVVSLNSILSTIIQESRSLLGTKEYSLGSESSLQADTRVIILSLYFWSILVKSTE